MILRKPFFDSVRRVPFGGRLTESQVAGMEAIITAWEEHFASPDLRHLSYPLATTFFETGKTMQPVEEIGKGAGKPYGIVDSETGNIFYGRGLCQITWKANYQKASDKLGLAGSTSLVWHPERALEPAVAAAIMFRGMNEGWFRAGHKLSRYFSTVNDPYNARDIINGDKRRKPAWANGWDIGSLVKGYHDAFLVALQESTPIQEKVLNIKVVVRGEGPFTVEVDAT